MGWFDDVLGSITGKDIVGGITTVLAGQQAKKATQQAANTALDANAMAMRMAQQGRADSQRRLAQIADQGRPGVQYLQSVVAQDPNRLTPGQEIQLSDRQRDWNARLAKSGLRGAGRTTAAVFNDVTNRARAQMLDANAARRSAAAGTLAGTAINADSAAAGLANSGGQDAARIMMSSGDTAANAVRSSGVTDAQTLANVLGSVMARDEEPRASRYERVTVKG